MGYLIDANFFVWAERASLDWGQVVASHTDESVAIAALTACELLHGVHRANTEERRVRREAFVQTILRSVPVLDYTLDTAKIHAGIWADLQNRGETIGPHDIIIGATALAAGCKVVTANEREFRRIPGLIVENWAK